MGEVASRRWEKAIFSLYAGIEGRNGRLTSNPKCGLVVPRSAPEPLATFASTFSYSGLKQTAGLGYLNRLEAARGVHCHSSLALRADGVVLGLLHQHYWVRPDRLTGVPP